MNLPLLLVVVLVLDPMAWFRGRGVGERALHDQSANDNPVKAITRCRRVVILEFKPLDRGHR